MGTRTHFLLRAAAVAVLVVEAAYPRAATVKRVAPQETAAAPVTAPAPAPAAPSEVAAN